MPVSVVHTFWCLRREMMRSMPLNAPDATNSMLVVSTATLSPRSFRELRSGTLTIVPSSSFSIPWMSSKTYDIACKHNFTSGNGIARIQRWSVSQQAQEHKRHLVNASKQSFSCDVLARTVSDDFPLISLYRVWTRPFYCKVSLQSSDFMTL